MKKFAFLLLFVSVNTFGLSVIPDSCYIPPGCSLGESAALPSYIQILVTCPHDTGEPYPVGVCNIPLYNQTPQKQPDPNDLPANQCGSIINVDSLSLGESVPVVGTSETLTYFSDRVVGRKGDYSFSIPVVREPQDPNLTKVIFDLTVAGRNLHYEYNPQPGLKFEYTWDGKNSLGKFVEGAADVKVKVSQKYSVPTVDYPVEFNFQLGAWKAKLVGLGGWTLSSHHYYDPLTRRIYYGSGSIRSAEGIPFKYLSGVISTEDVINPDGYLVTAADGSEAYIFSLLGKHLETRSARSGAILKIFNYNSNNELTGIVDNFGNNILISKVNSKQITITSSKGQITRLYLNSSGYVTQIRDPLGRNHHMTYLNADGLLTSFQKPSGAISNFYYNSAGQLTRDESSFGTFLNFVNQTISSSRRQITMSSAENRTTVYDITTQNGYFYRSEVSPYGATSAITYYNSSGIYRQTEAESSINQDFRNDDRFSSLYPRSSSNSTQSGTQNLISYTNYQTDFSSSNILKLNSETQSYVVNGKTWRTNYDGSTKTSTFISPLNRTSSLTYNNVDQVVQSVQGNNQPTSLSYTSSGKLAQVAQASRLSQFTYNDLDQISEFKNALGEISKFSYDRNGNVIKQILADGRILTYSYDLNGNLSGIKPSGRPWHYFNYNLIDLMAEYIAPLVDFETKTSYEYNLDKQLKKMTLADGKTIQFNYGQTTGLLDSIQTVEGLYSRQYNEKGQLTSVTSPQSVQTNINYDGELISGITTAYGSLWTQLNYNYQNFLMRKISIRSSASNPVEFNISYDDDNLVTQVGDLYIQRDAVSGKVSATQLQNIQEQYQYDPTYGELASYRASYNGSLILEELYTRDLLGRISSKTVTTREGTKTYSYAYDPTGRLIQVSQDGSILRTYKYDSNSNRLYVAQNGRYLRGTYDYQDRMLSYHYRKYSYTQAGSRTVRYFDTNPRQSEYTYNTMGTLQQAINTGYNSDTLVTTVNTFDYVNDGLGRRLEKKKNGALAERYMYDENGRLIAELNSAGKIISYFIYATRSHVPDYMVRLNVKYKLIHDHLGSVRFVVNASTGEVLSKIEYDEFGIVQPNPLRVAFQPFGFAGGIYDASLRLLKFGARDYEPQTGRWLSKDPILFSGGDTNLYGYVLQDPVNFIDPSGLKIGDWWDLPANYSRAQEIASEEHANWAGHHNDWGDAMRHYEWSHRTTSETNTFTAFTAGWGHEIEYFFRRGNMSASQYLQESLMDLHNNSIGRESGRNGSLMCPSNLTTQPGFGGY